MDLDFSQENPDTGDEGICFMHYKRPRNGADILLAYSMLYDRPDSRANMNAMVNMGRTIDGIFVVSPPPANTSSGKKKKKGSNGKTVWIEVKAPMIREGQGKWQHVKEWIIQARTAAVVPTRDFYNYLG